MTFFIEIYWIIDIYGWIKDCCSKDFYNVNKPQLRFQIDSAIDVSDVLLYVDILKLECRGQNQVFSNQQLKMATVQVSEDDIQTFFDRALELVKEAGVVVSEAISLDKEVSTKLTDCDVVTLTDKAVEKMLFDGLR